ncbi:hypothetical protein POSPLADRAFT_1032749 [Postia placenta MAD-698-R-SB12]|uniref:Uncharacterized protein n=1 Tax=Postia placenta MAD-698-R-SB12 TaxID=670580 RepID=A0A1X6N6W6_9APHY|nr:hypothetical protein POSPLADRAFT_1032749 [Postia placenta MAD-698-R-SB12]OSX64367.1 hypothetical protein POSPLADRAFT_1032749 [Postia placenta MAD-698-R-SB12]
MSVIRDYVALEALSSSQSSTAVTQHLLELYVAACKVAHILARLSAHPPTPPLKRVHNNKHTNVQVSCNSVAVRADAHSLDFDFNRLLWPQTRRTDTQESGPKADSGGAYKRLQS